MYTLIYGNMRNAQANTLSQHTTFIYKQKNQWLCCAGERKQKKNEREKEMAKYVLQWFTMQFAWCMMMYECI